MFEAVLKNDGIYVNKKIVEEDELLLPSREECPYIYYLDDTLFTKKKIQKV